MSNAFVVAILAVTLLFASSFVDAEPKVLSFDYHRRSDAPRHEAHHIKARAKTVSQSLTWGSLLYYVNITLGTPGQGSAVWLDTGSSDLWVPDLSSSICAENQEGCSNNGGFNPSKSSTYEVAASDEFQIAYASGDKIAGDYGKDVLQLNGAKLKGMYFGVASQGGTTTPLNGIMGVGYPLGESLVTNSEIQQQQPYPNLISQLVNQGYINSRSYSLYLNDLENGHGTILFGGIDTAKFSGDLGVVDVQQNAETGNYDTFTVVLAGLSFSAKGDTSKLDIGKGLPVILDSGTTLTYFPDDIAQQIYDGLGVLNDNEVGPVVPCNVDTSGMKFTFTFGSTSGVAIDVDLSQFVVPYNAEAGLPPINGGRACTFGIFPAGAVANGGGDILFGDTFLRSAYIVYDLDNNQIGIAQTKFDVTDSSIKEIGSSPTQTINTIPGATTVTGAVSLAQTNTQMLQPTDFLGAASTTEGSFASATSHAATFAGVSGGLKTTGSSASSASSSSSSSAATALQPALFNTLMLQAYIATIGGIAMVVSLGSISPW